MKKLHITSQRILRFIRYISFLTINILKEFFIHWTSLIFIIVNYQDLFGFLIALVPPLEPIISSMSNLINRFQMPFPFRNIIMIVLILVSSVRVIKNRDKIITIKKDKFSYDENTFKVNKLILSPDQKYLASASDRKAFVWVTDTQNVFQKLQCTTWIGNILFTNNNQYLIGIGGKGKFFEWDLLTGLINREFILESTDSVALSKTINDDYIATANKNGQISIWKYPELSKELELLMGNCEIRKIAFSNDGTQLVACNILGKVSVFSLPDKTETVIFWHSQKSTIRYVCYSPTNKEIAFVDGEGNLYVYCNVDFKMLHKRKSHERKGLCCAFNNDGTFIASGGEDNTIIIWENSKTNLRKRLIIRGHNDAVTTLAFDAFNNLYSGSRDKLIKYWEIGRYLF